jgi:hypothetical protein
VKVIITTTDGGNLTIEDFDAPSIMQLLEDWETINILAFALDDGMAYIPKNNITRIDTIG